MNSDRAKGVLLGLACGDALGRPVEFQSERAIERAYGTLTDMVGYGTWNQPPGTVTDDTEQALSIARSLVERDGFDPEDIAHRFLEWYRTGPFDVGDMTRRSFQRLLEGDSWELAGKAVWRATEEGSNAGNGSVMRCPPLAIAFAYDLDTLVSSSRQSSAITHADPRCTEGSTILNLTIAGILRNDPAPLETALNHVRNDGPDSLVRALEPLANDRPISTLSTSGYVVDTLQTALHDGLTAESPEDAIITAVNRGGDTDTIGAIAGAIAGARFGASALPDQWVSQVDVSDELSRLARKLRGVNSEERIEAIYPRIITALSPADGSATSGAALTDIYQDDPGLGTIALEHLQLFGELEYVNSSGSNLHARVRLHRPDETSGDRDQTSIWRAYFVRTHDHRIRSDRLFHDKSEAIAHLKGVPGPVDVTPVPGVDDVWTAYDDHDREYAVLRREPIFPRAEDPWPE